MICFSYFVTDPKYEILPDDNSFYGHIPGFDGLYANAETLERCREELEDTLEDWILLGSRNTTFFLLSMEST